MMIKVWTGSVWSWVKVRITGREMPDGVEMESPSLIRRGKHWWLRVSPRNTSRECARRVPSGYCHGLVARYQEGKPAEGYTYGAPLVLCSTCGMKGNADRNASLVIGQRLVARYEKPLKEKPHIHERGEQSPGVAVCQDAQSANAATGYVHLPKSSEALRQFAHTGRLIGMFMRGLGHK